VDTFEGVLEMLEQLKQVKEIAVDLEHHDFRTYTGLVSLMQISTRDQDWIVDTLKPWRHKLQVLNQVLADPSIIKVFHGAHMDMIWLQRDLGLYVNGVFDTYFACVLLGYQGRSLAFLLSKFVNFDADKQYQLADWRLRPLPEEMLYYARSDTHFLLYIYDCVRNDLVASSNPDVPDGNLLQETLNRSRDQALSRHEHATFDEETGQGARGWYAYILKQGHLALKEEQFATFRAIWKWRDETARKEDDSPNFVLGNHNITEIAKYNPPDKKALHSLLPAISPYARPRLNEIWDGIQQAKARGGPSLLQFLTTTSPDFMGKPAPSATSRWTANLPVLEGEIEVGKLPKSQLFGNVPLSSRWERQDRAAPSDEDRVPFPWQRYVDAVASQGETDELSIIPEPEPAVQEPDATAAQDAEEDVEDEEFTLKRGKKRKSAPDAEDTSSSEDGDESEESDDEESEEAEEQADAQDEALPAEDDLISNDEESRKNGQKSKQDNKKKKTKESTTARKARKEQEKKNKENQDAKPRGKKEKFNAVPFDYSQAASVMNANRNGNAGDKAQAAKKPVFDPYAKASESDIKGARKAMPVRGEKSGTFKK
jgi:exosome complex exonuclease RRP6